MVDFYQRKLKIANIHVSSSRSHVLEEGSFPTSMGPPGSASIPFICCDKKSRLLNKIMMSGDLTMVLVVPLLQKEWFPDLLSLLVEQPHQLPLFWNHLVLPHIWKFHQGLKVIQLHTGKLSSSMSTRQAFHQRLIKEQQPVRKSSASFYHSKWSTF